MKKQLLFGLLGAAGGLWLASSMVSCDDYRPTTDMDGKLLVSVDLDKDVVTSASNKHAANNASRADAQSVSASDLSLRLTSETGTFAREWAKASDFNDPVTVPVGKYTIEAYYGSLESEGFEMPYYYGSSTLTVEENRTTPVSVTAQLANSMVRVEMSDMFRGYFASYSLTLRSELGNEIAYADGESRPVYLAPGQVTAAITITKQNGTTATLEPKSFTAEARHSYLLKFDINGGEAGDGTLVLTYDDMTAMEDVEIDLSDAILNAPAPRLTTDGFTSGAYWTVMPGHASEKAAKVTAIAQAGIDGLVLTTSSAYLESQGWPKEIDLVSGDAATIAQMKALGLKVIGVPRPDKMVLVDFTDLLSNIAYLEGGDNLSTFSLQVRDKNSRVAEAPVSFSVETVTTTLSVVSHDPIYEWDTTLAFDVETNAADLTGITLQAKNDRNTWDNCPITSCELVSRADNRYHVVATVPSSATDLPLRLTFGALKVDFTVAHEPSPYSLKAVENGIYGWQAALDLRYKAGADAARRRAASRSAEAPENVTFEISADNGQTWSATTASKLDTNRFLISGLTGGKTYQVRATCDGILSGIYTFTTEIGPQLYNSDMNLWYSVIGDKKYSGTCYWTRDYPGDSEDTIWGTMNLKTTSSSSGTYQGCAYGNFSGTRGTDDSRSGKAAIIETVGWGDNKAPALSGRFGTCKNVDAGQLYLGHYDANTKLPVYGISYDGRPKNVEFYYKYTAKNQADYGKAFAKVLDANGNVLASAELRLTAIGSYTKQTLDLSAHYNAVGNKGVTLQIGFISSDNADCLVANSNNMSHPGMWNLSDGRFTGSSLYVDDIKLNY